jgi:hypothetical protein
MYFGTPNLCMSIKKISHNNGDNTGNKLELIMLVMLEVDFHNPEISACNSWRGRHVRCQWSFLIMTCERKRNVDKAMRM